MTTDHANDHTANGFFDQADQDCIWGHEDDLIAEAELELAADDLLDTLLDEERKEHTYDVSDLYPEGWEPKHDHAPGHGDIFSCPACIANTTY